MRFSAAGLNSANQHAALGSLAILGSLYEPPTTRVSLARSAAGLDIQHDGRGIESLGNGGWRQDVQRSIKISTNTNYSPMTADCSVDLVTLRLTGDSAPLHGPWM